MSTAADENARLTMADVSERCERHGRRDEGDPKHVDRVANKWAPVAEHEPARFHVRALPAFSGLDAPPVRGLLCGEMTSATRTWAWSWRHERGGSVA
jgi:hypothetical protein